MARQEDAQQMGETLARLLEGRGAVKVELSIRFSGADYRYRPEAGIRPILYRSF